MAEEGKKSAADRKAEREEEQRRQQAARAPVGGGNASPRSSGEHKAGGSRKNWREHLDGKLLYETKLRADGYIEVSLNGQTLMVWPEHAPPPIRMPWLEDEDGVIHFEIEAGGAGGEGRSRRQPARPVARSEPKSSPPERAPEASEKKDDAASRRSRREAERALRRPGGGAS